jgi:D-threo-aldose 1-dehydrogenase
MGGSTVSATTRIELARRQVGRTQLSVTEIGFGTGSLGGLFTAIPEAQGREAIRTALKAGIGYIDTAPFYGFGRSERLVGDVLRETAADVVLSTKVGRLLAPYWGTEANRAGWVDPLPFEARYDYSYDGIMRSVADSWQRLGRTAIDVLYVHDIGTMNHGADGNAVYWRQLAEGGYRALRELRADGTVKAIGLGVNEWQVLVDALEIGDWDVFLLAQRYTLLEQHSLKLMETCRDRGTSVVIGGVFNGGALMGTGVWNYGAAPDHILKRVAQLFSFCIERGVPIGAAAVQMPLAHPAVCSVLCGSVSSSELEQFLAWSHVAIPTGFWRDLAASNLIAAGTILPAGFIAS